MCKFCEALQSKKRAQDFFKEREPELMSGVSDRYSVAIVTRTFVKGMKGPRGSTTDYRYRGCGYELNFCPECGRELRKEK